MSTKELFLTALGLDRLWYIKEITFNSTKNVWISNMTFIKAVNSHVQNVELNSVLFMIQKNVPGAILIFFNIKRI